jgi:hypothetical protein
MALAVLFKGKVLESRRILTRGFIATIFDLARRDYLTIREEVKPHFIFFEKKDQRFIITRKGRNALSSTTSKLLDFELLVLKFLFQIVPSGQDIHFPWDMKFSKLLVGRLPPTKDIDVLIKSNNIYPEVTASDIVKWNKKRRKGWHLISLMDGKAHLWFRRNFFSIFTSKSRFKS